MPDTVSDIDYSVLGGSAGGEPPDGWKGDATLIRAARVGSPTKLITEWTSTTNPPLYWQTWFNFGGGGLAVTQEFLDALGVDRAKLVSGASQEERDDAFDTELYNATGQVFAVETSRWAKGVNTFVVGSAGRVVAQERLDDVPIEVEDLPPAGVGASAATPAEDDIPF